MRNEENDLLYDSWIYDDKMRSIPSQWPFDCSMRSCRPPQPFELSQQQEIPRPLQDIQRELALWKAHVLAEPDQEQPRYVNYKQWPRMIKRRVKKGLQMYLKGKKQSNEDTPRKYKYQSRHDHAVRRERIKGRFVATRPQEQRNKVRTKRGRKPKSEKLE